MALEEPSTLRMMWEEMEAAFIQADHDFDNYMQQRGWPVLSEPTKVTVVLVAILLPLLAILLCMLKGVGGSTQLQTNEGEEQQEGKRKIE